LIVCPQRDLDSRTPAGTTLSVVVPLRDEEGNVGPLVCGVRAAVGEREAWELILVDDGSRDDTAAVVQAHAAEDARIRFIRLARNYGQSAALQAGFDRARGDVVVTMDGDLQNDPEDIPLLIEKLREGYDLVAGYRATRRDPLLTRRFPSWVANRLVRKTTGVPIRDTGCTLRAYRRELVERMHVYSDLHRFLPAIAAATAGARITEIPVRHHSRRSGRSKYGLSRILKVQLDLLTLKMIQSFRDRPLALFAIGSLASWVTAAAFGGAAIFNRIHPPLPPGNAVFTAVALLCFALGCYLLFLGLIGEVAIHEFRRQWRDSGSIVWEERP
jgi:glycosyltransferase involved in cell wall biosynthesis